MTYLSLKVTLIIYFPSNIRRRSLTLGHEARHIYTLLWAWNLDFFHKQVTESYSWTCSHLICEYSSTKILWKSMGLANGHNSQLTVAHALSFLKCKGVVFTVIWTIWIVACTWWCKIMMIYNITSCVSWFFTVYL